MSSPKLPARSLTLPEGSPAEIDAELQAIADRLPEPEPEQGSHAPPDAGPPDPEIPPPVKAEAGPRSGGDQAGPRVYPAPRTLGGRPADLPESYGAPAVDLNALVAQAHACAGNVDISLRRLAGGQEAIPSTLLGIRNALDAHAIEACSALDRMAAMAEWQAHAAAARLLVADIEREPAGADRDSMVRLAFDHGRAADAIMEPLLSSLPDQVAATIPGPLGGDSGAAGSPDYPAGMTQADLANIETERTIGAVKALESVMALIDEERAACLETPPRGWRSDEERRSWESRADGLEAAASIVKDWRAFEGSNG